MAECVVGYYEHLSGIGRLDGINVVLERQRVPVEEIARARGAIESDLISAEDEASEGVPGVADAGEVAPGAGGVAGVDADAVAVNAADGLAGGFVARGAAHVAQAELVG